MRPSILLRKVRSIPVLSFLTFSDSTQSLTLSSLWKSREREKKVCYNELDLPLIAIDDLEELGKDNELYAELAKIVKRNGGLWCAEAEAYLLAHAPRI